MLRTLVWLESMLLAAVCIAHPAHAERTKISVSLMVPDMAWKIRITKVSRVSDELWVVARLNRAAGALGAQVITTAADAVEVDAPPLPVKYFILGKTWGWANDEGYTFLHGDHELPAELKSGVSLYRAE